MPRQLVTLVNNVEVPYMASHVSGMNARLIVSSGTIILLNDEEFANLSPTAIGATLQDLGPFGSSVGADGIPISKAAQVLPNSGVPQTIFTVAGGRVLLKDIVGTVTVAIQAQSTNAKLQFDPTGAPPATDLCANLDLNNNAIGTLYSIVGVAATAMQTTAGIYFLPAAKLPAQGIILPTGILTLLTGATSTGSIKWDAWYVPLDPGAVMS